MSDDDEAEAAVQPNVPPKVPFNADTMECVLDVRALCGLPQDSDEEGALAFRALLLPKGKTLHVPDEPGCYATLGPWHSQLALCEVHFVAATARSPELLLAFADYGMLNANRKGVFAMSLQLPLQKARNVFEETARFTKVADISGFSPIDVKRQPWCSLLEPALKRQPIYEEQKLYTPADIINHMRIPLATRIEALVKSARNGIAEKVKDLARQDNRQAQKASARMEAQLDAAHEFLKALPPKKYDRRMEQRVIVVEPDASGGPGWLTTPKRAELKSAAAVCMPTARVNRVEPAAPAPAVAAEPAEPAPAAAAPAAAIRPEISLSDDDDDGDGSDVDETSVPLEVVGTKRARKTVSQFDPAPAEKKKVASTSKAAAKAVSAIPKHTLPTAPHTRHRPSPIAVTERPTVGAVPQAEKRAIGINPRTNKPFVRPGGAYKSNQDGPAGVLKALEAARKAAEKKEAEKDMTAALRSQVATLEAQLNAAQAAAEKAEAAAAVAVEKAKLEATQMMHADLLARYRDGLRDGACLSGGRSGSLASDSPASGAWSR